MWLMKTPREQYTANSKQCSMCFFLNENGSVIVTKDGKGGDEIAVDDVGIPLPPTIILLYIILILCYKYKYR